MSALQPSQLDFVGKMLAIVWSDGVENYLPQEELRAASPSAETVGERDLLGRRLGGEARRDYSGVELLRWEVVGGYALRFYFSDGHSSGLYSYEYLRALAQELGGAD